MAESTSSAEKIRRLEEEIGLALYPKYISATHPAISVELKARLKEKSSSSLWSTAVVTDISAPPRNDPLSSAASLWVNYGMQSNSPELAHTTMSDALSPGSEQVISHGSIAMKKAILNGVPSCLGEGTAARALPIHSSSYSNQDKILKTGWDSKLPDPIVMKQMFVLPCPLPCVR